MDYSKIKLSSLLRNISCQKNKDLLSELYDMKTVSETLDRPPQGEPIHITKVKPIISGPPLPLDDITSRAFKPYKKRQQSSA